TTSIQQYETEYSRMPISKAGLASASPDFTFGTTGLSSPVSVLNKDPSQSPTPFQTNNSEVLYILRDIKNPLNPRQIPFFHAKDATTPNGGGIGSDGVFRDLWGNPYIITLDMNDDNKSVDS